MNEQDIITITKCLPELVEKIQISEKFTVLLVEEKGVFSKPMMDDILASENKPRKLLIELQRRGPKAYQKLIEALAKTGQNEVIEILSQQRVERGFPAHEGLPLVTQNEDVVPVTDPTANPMSPEYQNKVLSPPSYPEDIPSSPGIVIDARPPTDYESMKIVVKPAKIVKTGEEVYMFNGLNPRGLALILNYKTFSNPNLETREGSDKDVIHLDQLLQALGYRVTVRSDLKSLETLEVITSFINDEGHSKADSTVVAIMSHGREGTLSEGTHVYTSDSSITSEGILRKFNGENCPNLKGKPKIFLFQFCRGDQRNSGIDRTQPRAVVRDGKQVQSSEQEVDRAFEDMLIAYSTLPGHVSYREEAEGTWFIKAICKIFTEHACEVHVVRLLNLVDDLIKKWTALEKHNSNCKQTTEISQRGFNKKFYFNPGLLSNTNPTNS